MTFNSDNKQIQMKYKTFDTAINAKQRLNTTCWTLKRKQQQPKIFYQTKTCLLTNECSFVPPTDDDACIAIRKDKLER